MICPNCGSEMLLKTKEGQQFWGCKNWKTRGCKTQPLKKEIEVRMIPTETDKTPLRMIYGLLEQMALKIGITKEEIALIQDKIKQEKK